MSILRARLILLAVLVSSSLSRASTTTVDFESFSDDTVLTNQIAGLTFTNTHVWSAGLSLNELEFPPHSGSNVAVDSGGPIFIDFSSSVLSFSGFFTYSTSLALTAFNGGLTVGTVNSSSASNFVSSGNSPNEFLQVSFAGGITRVRIAADPNGSSLTLDDATVTTSASAVPEPSSGLLLATGAIALILSGNWIARIRSAR